MFRSPVPRAMLPAPWMPSEQPGEGRGVRVGPSRRDDRNRQTTAEGAVRLGADVSQCPRQQGVIAPAPRIMRLFRAFSPSNPPESPSQEESSFASMLDTLESKSRSDGPPAGPRSIGLLPDSRSFLTVSAVA